MKIFFAGAVRGGRANQPHYVYITDTLKQYGTVISGHVADESISEFGETELTKEEIYSREIAALETSDVVVAEVTTPSLGVGYIIGLATSLGKKVVAFYSGENTLKLSAMIKGDK